MKNQVQYISFFLNLNGLLSSFSIQFLNNVCLISKRGLLQLVSTIQNYRDDFVIMARYMTKEIVSWVESKLETRFGLTVNREKTKIVNLNDPKAKLKFLGFELRRVPLRHRQHVSMCLITPAEKSIKKAMEKVSEITDATNGFKPIEVIVRELNQFLIGWGNYFKLGHPGQVFNKLNNHVCCRLYRFLQRRSQKGFKKPNKEQTWYKYVQKLGVKQLTKRACHVKA